MMDDIGEADRAKEYRDSAKGNAVDYIDSEAGNYAGFYWGIPGNLEMRQTITTSRATGLLSSLLLQRLHLPQDTVTAIMAFSSVGMNDKADIIRRQIFRRSMRGSSHRQKPLHGRRERARPVLLDQRMGRHPDRLRGIISRDCSFLQSAILIKDPATRILRRGRENQAVKPLFRYPLAWQLSHTTLSAENSPLHLQRKDLTMRTTTPRIASLQQRSIP